MSGERGSLRGGLSRWASASRDEARDLRRHSEEAGLVCIGEAPDRETVTLRGILKSVTLRPRGGVPALEAELYDGSGSIVLIWLGRRRIAGLAPGGSLQVDGRIGLHEGQRVMYNPRYALRS